MIIIPRAKPIVINLNSYYLDMEKLIAHYQAELRSGGIHLKSPGAEGIIFFDEDTITNVFFQEKNIQLDGISARDELIRNLKAQNFIVSVYQIEPEKFHFWANLSYAEDLHRDLNIDTALDGLIKSMNTENLTGYIEIAITGTSDHSLIFFINGNIIGVTCPWEHVEPSDTKQNLQRLILESKNSGASFNVKRIDLSRFQGNSDSSAKREQPPGEIVALLQLLISTLESLIAAEKRIKTDFDTLLKKKFFEKADTYEFLDPFAAEVQYANGTFEFTGDTPLPQIVKGVSESVLELAEDMGLLALLMQKIDPLKKQYQAEIIHFGINI
ncbi:MAG: hypothetical protein P1P89_17945 [Desulfobacterales bacterium]|nr:hypothetical protein [Desulfobacterales bacterium]